MRGASSDAGTAAGGRLADTAWLLLAWTAAVALVDPRGDFPLNDDWAYALAVRRLLEDGVFRPPDWAAPTLLSQALWGALASLPAGFSHTALRLSALALGGLAVVGVYLLGRELRAPRAVARLAALTLAAGPVFFALAHTFMTDVPFVACAVVALLGFARYLLRGADRDLALGAAASLAAVLCRQTGLVLPLAFAVAALLAGRGAPRQRWPRALLPLALCGGALGLLGWWLAVAGDSAQRLGVGDVMLAWRLRGNPPALLRFLSGNLLLALLYCGLFLAPLALRLAPVWRRRWTRPAWNDALSLATLATAALTLWSWGRHMPLRGNVLITSGVGPVTLHDWYILGLPHDGPLPAAFWIAVTGVALLGAALLAAQLGAAAAAVWRPAGAAERAQRGARALLLLAAAGYLSVVILVSPFDRYYLPLVAMLAPLLAAPGAAAAGAGRAPRLAAAALLLALAGFSIAATHDYLAWNRARWQGLRQLTEVDGISPRRIDGGAEFNGLHLFAPDYRKQPKKSWWWVADDEYMLGMGPLPGYALLRRYPYARWLPPGEAEIQVLRRAP